MDTAWIEVTCGVPSLVLMAPPPPLARIRALWDKRCEKKWGWSRCCIPCLHNFSPAREYSNEVSKHKLDNTAVSYIVNWRTNCWWLSDDRGPITLLWPPPPRLTGHSARPKRPLCFQTSGHRGQVSAWPAVLRQGQCMKGRQRGEDDVCKV